MVGVYEIELKALLSKEQYDTLKHDLPHVAKLILEESLNTAKFKTEDTDIRLRWSDKTFEIVCKDGKATDLSRKEITIPLNSADDVQKLIHVFQSLRISQDPSWITHKNEYTFNYEGFTYKISLQHTENFAYILEVEYTSEDNDNKLHENNIKEIFKKLNVEPIDAKEFSAKIKEYIKNNKIS